MGPGRDWVTPIVRYQPQVHIALLHQGHVVLVWRQTEELLAQLVRQAQLCLENMKPVEALERLAVLPWLSHLLTQRKGPGVALAHFRHRMPLRRHQSRPQAEQKCEFVLSARRAVREGRQQRQPFGEGGDRFVMGIASGGIVCRLLEIAHSTLDLAPALEVDDELGGDFPGPGTIAGLQTAPNASMQLHPPRGPYLLVQDLLVQDMLKAVAAPTGAIRPDGYAGVVEKVVLHRQRFTLRLDVFDGALEARRDRRDDKLPPCDTGAFQHPPCLGREGLDTPRQ